MNPPIPRKPYRSKPKWHWERAMILARLVRCLEKAASKGQSIQARARRLARGLKGRTYRTSPGRPVQISKFMLVRKYYEWRQTRDPEVFRLKYEGPKAKVVPANLASEFIQLVQERPEQPITRIVGHLASRHELNRFPSYDSFSRRIPEHVKRYRRALRKVDRERNRLLRQKPMITCSAA